MMIQTQAETFALRIAEVVPQTIYRGLRIPEKHLPGDLGHQLLHHAFPGRYIPPQNPRPAEDSTGELLDYIHGGAQTAGHATENLFSEHPGLGVHWTTDRGLAEKFAAPGKIDANGRGHSILLSAQHPGEHAIDPENSANMGYRNPETGEVYDPSEVPIRPGTPLSLSSVEMHEPQAHGEWSALPFKPRTVNA